MNAYEILRDLLAAPGQTAPVFGPLDDEGQSLFLAANMTPIRLSADPEDEDSLWFSLSAPLLSLEGAGYDLQLNFLWRVYDESGPGALPPGYSFFSNSEDLALYLGARLPAQGLALGSLETMTDEFYRMVQVLRAELTDRLTSQAALAEQAATEEPEEGYYTPPEAFLKV